MNEFNQEEIVTKIPESSINKKTGSSEGKILVMIIAVIDTILGAISAMAIFAAKQLQQAMMKSSLEDQYGIPVTVADGGVGTGLFIAFLTIGLTVLLAWFLVKGANGARILRLIFAVLGLLSSIATLLFGGFAAILGLVYGGFTIYVLAFSKAGKAHFAN